MLTLQNALLYGLYTTTQTQQTKTVNVCLQYIYGHPSPPPPGGRVNERVGGVYYTICIVHCSQAR